MLYEDLLLRRSEEAYRICSHECVSDQEVDNAYQKFKTSQAIASLAVGLLCLSTAGQIGALEAIGLAITGIFVVNFTSCYWSSSFKKWMALDSKRSQAIGVIKGRIEDLESHANGFLWRIFAKLQQSSKEFTSDQYVQLAKASKEQCFLSLSNRYEDYKHCLSVAREAI